MTIFKSLLSFLGAACASAFVVLSLWVDIYFWDYNISELSLTEIVQESVLTAIVFIHFLLARRYKAMRYCNILVGGFFLAMLIRELDALFDLIAHGSWVCLLISGLLAILVFSRLFGMQALWLAILDDGYVRVVKNVVEEGSESFGYMLCLTASIGYFCTFRETLAQKSY